MNRVTGGVTPFDAITYCWSLALHSLATYRWRRMALTGSVHPKAVLRISAA